MDALIFQAIEEGGVRGLAVAAGSAGFLVVGFEGVGELVVVDEADVGLVDAEAEGLGGDHDFELVVHEGLLGGFAFSGGEAAVVEGCGDAVILKEREEFIGGADAGGCRRCRFPALSEAWRECAPAWRGC